MSKKKKQKDFIDECDKMFIEELILAARRAERKNYGKEKTKKKEK